MNKLYVMCGLPASGKTTYLKDKEYVVSRDKIRFSMVDEKDEYFAKETDVYKEFIKQIKNGLQKGKEVYADATHLNPRSRNKLLKALKDVQIDKKCAINFTTPFEVCLMRNSERKGRERVPDKTMRDMLNSFKYADYNEGFDEIIYYDGSN